MLQLVNPSTVCTALRCLLSMLPPTATRRLLPCCSWPTLLLALLSMSRALVCCWGAVGWRLPLQLQAPVQLVHVLLLAWRVAPSQPVCGGPSTIERSGSKLQVLALALDWPLRAVGGPPLLMAPQGACMALTVWLQFTCGFLLPIAVQLSADRAAAAAAASALPAGASRAGEADSSSADPSPSSGSSAGGSRTARAAEQPPLPPQLQLQLQQPAEGAGSSRLLAYLESFELAGWPLPALTFFASQMAWLLLRVALNSRTEAASIADL